MSFSTFLLIYITGGLTFIPLVLLGVLAFSYHAFTKPAPLPASGKDSRKEERPITPADHSDVDDKSKDEHGQAEPVVTSAYFAVCREYVPGGINGKPPERSTPAGEVLIAESPSVYQSMYRSIFERGKAQIPTIESDKRDGRAVKKARNVFFVVLRHGHLMLYDDAEQVEVRHVISLAHHSIDIYAGGEPLPEGDLWIKRNCIRLTRKPSASAFNQSSKPFHFFSDSCSEKEDFYHTLMLYQSASKDEDAPPRPKPFKTQDIIKLVQLLHGPDADPHSRWINALINRIFLAMYKTDDIENFIRGKINRKISRVPKPNFIASIDIQDIDMGDSGPIISNPRLKDMNVNGDTTIEFDVKYNGGFKLQMGAVARIDLGSRLKAREVSLIMAGTLRKLSGHVLVRIKPPPSNRMWITFETMPHIEMSIEPIVSSRQITYGVILRAIESRIREVIGETLVMPNWDDSPFLDTSRKEFRGGIFETNATTNHTAKSKAKDAEDHALETAVNELAKHEDSDAEETDPSPLKDSKQKTMSMPSLLEPVQKVNLRKAARKSVVTLAGDNTATTTGASTSGSSMPSIAVASPPLPARKPKTMRSNSFATAASPIVSTDGANVEALKPETRNKRNSRGAVDFVKEVKSRSQSAVSSPTASEVESGHEDVPPLDMDRDVLLETPEELDRRPIGNDAGEGNISETLRRLSEPATPGKEIADPGFSTPRSPSTSSIPITQSKSRAASISTTNSQSVPPASPSHLSTAATAAKKWGLNVLNRQSTNLSTASTSAPFSFGKRNSTNTSLASTASSSSSSQPSQNPQPHPDAARAAMLARGEPMGRGQPLPPPGTPLPGPPGQKSLWSTSNLNLGMGGMKRKAVPGPALPPRKGEQTKKVPPPLPARKQSVGQASQSSIPETGEEVGERDGRKGSDGDSLLVVAAPEDEDGGSIHTAPVAEGDTVEDIEFTATGDAVTVVRKSSTASETLPLSKYNHGTRERSSTLDTHGLGASDSNVLSKSTETIRPTSARDDSTAAWASIEEEEADQHQHPVPTTTGGAQDEETTSAAETGAEEAHRHQPLA